jgi:hypothetical protein
LAKKKEEGKKKKKLGEACHIVHVIIHVIQGTQPF